MRRYQKLLKRRLIYTEKGGRIWCAFSVFKMFWSKSFCLPDPLLPQYYYVPEDNLADERSEPYTQGRLPSKVGSTKENVFLWGQAMLIISDVMASGLVSTLDIDPIRRALPSSARPKSGTRHSTFEVSQVLNLLEASWKRQTSPERKNDLVNFSMDRKRY